MPNEKVIFDIICSNLRTRNLLVFALQQRGKERFELSRGNRPDLVIIDCEKPETKNDFLKYRRRFPECPAILLLNDSEDNDDFPDECRKGNEFLLLKPFSLNGLLAIIDQCLNSIHPNKSSTQTRSAVSVEKAENSKSLQVLPHQAEGRTAGQGENNNISVASFEINPQSSDNVKTSEEILESPPKTSKVDEEKTIKLAISQKSMHVIKKNAAKKQEIAGKSVRANFPFVLQSDIDLHKTSEVESIRLNIDNRILGYILRGILQQSDAQPIVIKLEIKDLPAFYLSPHTNSLFIPSGDIDLFELAQQDFDKQQVLLSPGEMPEPELQHPYEKLDAFLWKLALYTYRGYLPEEVNVLEPVYLRYWPNLTRFMPTPNGMRISALLCRQPAKMANIIRVLNIPQRHVFNFYAAASTLGLAGQAIRDSDQLLIPTYPIRASENHALIQQLVNKLNASGEAK